METDVLKDMLCKRPEDLTGETLKLFNAIMSIADERDELKKEIEELKSELQHKNDQLFLCDSQWEKHTISKTKIRKKLDEQYELWNTPNKQKEYSQEIVNILEELLEED